MISFIFSLIFLSVFCVPPLFAATEYQDVFTRVQVYGGEVDHLSLCAANPAVIYAGTGHAGLWLSQDSGATWTETNFFRSANSGSSRFSVDPDNPAIIVAYADEVGRLHRSEDSGQTWSEIGTDIFYIYPDTNRVMQIAYSPTDHNTYYILSNNTASDSGAVYKSTDRGKTWVKTAFSSNGKAVYDLAVDKNGVIFVSVLDSEVTSFPKTATKGWIYKSGDGGANWSTVSGIDLSNAAPWDIKTAVNANTIIVSVTGENSSSYNIMISTDQGTSFFKLTTSIQSAFGSTSFNDIAVSADGTSIFYFDAANGVSRVYKSVSSGASWGTPSIISTTVLDGNIQLDCHEILIDPTNSAKMYIADGYEFGFLKSVNSGVNWTISNSGLTAFITYDGKKGPQGYFYMVGRASIYKSTDSGSSWTKVYGYNPGVGSAYGFNHGVVAANPDASKDYVYAIGGGGKFLRSFDGGQTWATKDFSADHFNNYTWLLPASDIVFREDAPAVGYLAFGDVSATAATSRKYIFKTSDYGVTWTQLNLQGMSVQSLAIDSENNLYAGLGEISYYSDKSVAAGGLWKITSDTTWTQIGLADKIPYKIVIEPQNTKMIYTANVEDLAKTYGPLYVSKDKGLTWSKFGKVGNPNTSAWEAEYVVDITYSHPRFFFSNWEGIYVSANNGLSYKQIVKRTEIGGVQTLISGSLFAGANTGFWKLRSTELDSVVNNPKAYAYPNPFNANNGYTVLKYFVPQGQASSSLRISIYNIANELVYEYNESAALQGGSAYYYVWDGKNQEGTQCARGVYVVVFKSSIDTVRCRVVLVR